MHENSGRYQRRDNRDNYYNNYNRYDNRNRRGYGNYHRDRDDNYHRGGYDQVHQHAQQPKKQYEIPKNDEEFEQWKANRAKNKTVDNRTKTEDVTDTKGNDFEVWISNRALLMGIFEMGFEKPSPIQEQAIPTVLMGSSVLARAKNGTGKTGAFAIPCLDKVDPKKGHVQLLVLLPTRELALQTSHVFIELGKFLRLEIVVSTGGTNLHDDIVRLKRTVHIVIGTPGRLQDLNKHKCFSLDQCSMIVLDECDKLLSPDFLPAVEHLIQATPEKSRQLMLFSATFPSSIQEFKDKYLQDAKIINQMKGLTLQGITQYYCYVDEKEKVRCLYHLLTKLNINQCIIFCSSVRRVELLASKLHNLNFTSCLYIHGQMNQKYRNQVFHNFRTGKSRFLVCTDIFTRGIDIRTLNVVINFDFPRKSCSYLHRIGRSGRFGHLGLAINLVTNTDRENLCRIEAELNTEVQPIPQEVDNSLY